MNFSVAENTRVVNGFKDPHDERISAVFANGSVEVGGGAGGTDVFRPSRLNRPFGFANVDFGIDCIFDEINRISHGVLSQRSL